MSLGEGVPCEAFHLAPHLPNDVHGVALGDRLGVEGVAGAVEFVARPKLAAHAPPQNVGLAEVEPREPVRHFDHVFLVDHHPVGLGHQGQQHGVRVLAFCRVAVPFDVRLHHAASGHPRPNHRARRNQTQVVVHLQLAHEHPHGRGLHVKAPRGAGFAQHGPDAFVGLEPAHVVDVDACGGLRVPRPNHVEGVFDFAQAALTQNVKLVQAYVLGHEHVELHGGQPFGRHEQGAVAVDVVVGDQHPAGMEGQAAGEIAQHGGVLEHDGLHLAQPIGVEFSGTQGVDFVFGQAHDLAQFTHRGPVLEGVVRGEKRHVGEALEHVGHHVVAVGPREIDVEVRGVGAVEVDEALEVEVEFDGVDVGDAQQVRHQAVGPAAPSDVEVPLASRVAGDVPIDEEVRQVALLSNQPDFMLHPVEHSRVVVRISVGQTLRAQRPHERLVLVFRCRVGVRVVVQPAFRGRGQGHVASRHQRLRPRHQPGHLGKRVPQFRRPPQAIARVAAVGRVQAAQQRVVVDRPEQAVGVPIALAREGGRGLGDQPPLHVVPDACQPHRRHVPRLHSDPLVVSPPVVGHGGRPRVHGGHARPPDLFGQPRGVRRVGEVVLRRPAAQCGVAFRMPRQGHEAPIASVSDVHPQHGLDALLLRPPNEVPVRRRGADVGQGKAGHPHGLCPVDQFIDRQDAVAQAESAVRVEVHGGVNRTGILGAPRSCHAVLPPSAHLRAWCPTPRPPAGCATGTRPSQTPPASRAVRG